jgi:hypothetical protein
MENEISICQSCSMPMTKDEDFGTDEDGSKNWRYCKYCFQDGDFTDSITSKEEMIQKLVNMAGKMGKSKEEAEKMANEIIPKLKRWE